MPDESQVIDCTFSTETSLYLAYMPFIKNGGLFVRTLQTIPLGDELQLSVHLLNELEPFTIKAKVVWITPKGAQGNKPSGVGVQFVEGNARHFSNKIETILATMLKSTQFTDTL